MMTRLEFAHDTADLRRSLIAYNQGIHDHMPLAWSLLRQTKYWVHDRATGLFGPSKFVAFHRMDLATYRRARKGELTGAEFNGTRTRLHNESLIGSFHDSDQLRARLVAWADGAFCPDALDGLPLARRRVASIPIATHAATPAEWTGWAPLTSTTLASAPMRPGCYMIRVLDDERHGAQPIPRCADVDEAGTLDIGESKNLRSRLQALLRCMGDADRAGHMAGWRYAHLGMARHFPIDRLEVRWTLAPTKADAYALEGQLLQDYVQRFFELPPLNYKFNWSSV